MSLLVVTVNDSAYADASGRTSISDNAVDITALLLDEALSMCNILLPGIVVKSNYFRNPWNGRSSQSGCSCPQIGPVQSGPEDSAHWFVSIILLG